MSDTQNTDPTDGAARREDDAASAPGAARGQAADEGRTAPARPDAPQSPAPPAAPAPNAYRAAPPLPGAQAPYPQNGQAFGAAATGAYGAHTTQPTMPLGAASPNLSVTPVQKKSGAGRVAGLIVAAALVGGAAGLGTAYAGSQLWSTPATNVVQGGSTVTVNNTDDVTAATAIAAKVVPSVVTIEVSGGGSGGSGSGVVLSEDGYVATNTHVVTLDGASGEPTIRVTASDGTIYDARIVGTDPVYDLAVIKLEDASGLTAIDFADSSNLNVGDQTVAIGAPLGLSNTVTTGIVSALNRSIQIASSAAPESNGDEEQPRLPNGQSPFQFDLPGPQSRGGSERSISIAVIQTDAAINPGNSGGALVDGDGKLIGINVAIASAGSSGGASGSIGVGFSIPSNVVERVTGEIIADGSATHGLLGASVLDAGTVDGIDIAGAYIDEVTGDGAAAAAGIRADDVVTNFNGVPIATAIDLTAQVRAAAAGSAATVTFVREGETQTVDVTLGALG